MLFSYDMFPLIMKNNYKRSKPELTDIDEVEFKAFLGLLLHTSIYKSNEYMRSLFVVNCKDRHNFRAVMSAQQNLAILTAL